MSEHNHNHSVTAASWTDQEKDELLDFLRRFVVPLLREPHRFDAVAIEDRLAHDFPALRLLDPPRAHEPPPFFKNGVVTSDD